MNFLQKNPFMLLFTALLVLLVLFTFVKNRKLLDELELIKQENESYVKDLDQLNLQLEDKRHFIEDKDELYAKLAAELHKEKKRVKELEEEIEALKSGRKR